MGVPEPYQGPYSWLLVPNAYRRALRVSTTPPEAHSPSFLFAPPAESLVPVPPPPLGKVWRRL